VIAVLISQVITLVSAVVSLFALGYIAVRHQRLFLALFMYLTALENTRDFAPSLNLTLLGFSVYPKDLIAVLCVGAALARLGQWRIRGITRVATGIFIALVGLGVLSWIWTFGVQLGVNSWREEILAGSVLLYTTTRPRTWSWSDLRVIIVGPAVLVAVAGLVGILLFGLGSNTSTVVVNGVMEEGRPVYAPGSLLMLVGLWITVLSLGKWTASRVLIILILGGMVLLTQNRSVWISAILGVVAWWLVPRVGPRGRSAGLGGVSRTILVFLVATATAFVGVSIAALGQSASNEDTWLWRVARWVNSMSIPRSGIEWLVGSTLGPTPASTPGRFPTFAHSFYVDSIEKIGFIGLAVVMFLLLAVGRAHVHPSIDPLGLIVCASLLGYGAAYQVPPWGWMLAGILLTTTAVEHHGGARRSDDDGTVDLTESASRERAARSPECGDGMPAVQHAQDFPGTLLQKDTSKSTVNPEAS
jgi:hypothetical protein